MKKDIFRTSAHYSGSFAHLNTNSETSVRCSRIDLCRCLITVGNPSFMSAAKVRQDGLMRVVLDSIIKKTALIVTNISADRSNLIRHRIYDQHVSDEKRIVSYNIGMALAKFYSQKLIDIGSLIHLEFLKKHGSVTFSNVQGSVSREPDLLGQSPDGAWHIFEAKGTSNSGELGRKVNDAKVQTNAVSLINGVPPTTRSACATYFGANKILSRIEDPSPDGDLHVETPDERFYDAYYYPWRAARQFPDLRGPTVTVYDRQFRVSEMPFKGGKLIIGLDSEVEELLEAGLYERLNALMGRLNKISGFEEEVFSFGMDGYLVGMVDVEA